MFFQHLNRFRYKFFDIVQFSRSCSASAFRLTTCLLYHRSGFLSSLILKLLNFLNLDASKFLGADRNFSASIGSFQRLRAEASEVILLPQRLALTYNTTFKGFGKPFFKVFCVFFAFVYRSQFLAPNFRVFRAGLPGFFFYIVIKGRRAEGCTTAPLVQFFSSRFICCRVSQTATASIGSMPIRPMGMGPSTL